VVEELDGLAKILAVFPGDERGQDLVEYGLIAGLVALAAIAAIGRVGSAVSLVFTTVGAKITSSV
jgi:pilus assembly protein Flp/PilA